MSETVSFLARRIGYRERRLAKLESDRTQLDQEICREKESIKSLKRRYEELMDEVNPRVSEPPAVAAPGREGEK